MYDLIARSPSAEALRAELHRHDLFREAAASRLARSATAAGPIATTRGPGIAGRARAAFAGWGRPPARQAECADCA
jgi:hypothetical protein